MWRAHWGRWRTRRTLSSDRGSATVWTAGAIAVLCVVFGAVLAMGQAVVVRHRAAGAADLAALAAADHWTDGATAPAPRRTGWHGPSTRGSCGARSRARSPT